MVVAHTYFHITFLVGGAHPISFANLYCIILCFIILCFNHTSRVCKQIRHRIGAIPIGIPNSPVKNIGDKTSPLIFNKREYPHFVHCRLETGPSNRIGITFVCGISTLHKSERATAVGYAPPLVGAVAVVVA